MSKNIYFTSKGLQVEEEEEECKIFDKDYDMTQDLEVVFSRIKENLNENKLNIGDKMTFFDFQNYVLKNR